MTKYENKWIYAMYKGEQFLCEGTKEEICKLMGISINTFNFYRTSHYKINRNTHLNNRRMIIRIDGKDKIWN